MNVIHRRFYRFWSRPLLIGQSFSAFSASSLEYVSTVSGSHSLSETMLFLSLTLFGLISSKHFLHLLSFVCIPDLEISGIAPEACCFSAKFTLLYNDILY